MALDEALLQFSAPAVITFRLYSWSEPTVSLGYFQSWGLAREELGRLSPAAAACPMVRRPSGGGAILHDGEWTYSLIVPPPLAAGRTSRGWYDVVHRSLSRALSDWGILSQVLGPLARLGPVDEPFFCFHRRGEGDVTCQGIKIAGSAQRRRGGAILQHGSVLLRSSPYLPELRGIQDLASARVDERQLLSAWLERLSTDHRWSIQESAFSPAVLESAAELVARKYQAPLWNERR